MTRVDVLRGGGREGLGTPPSNSKTRWTGCHLNENKIRGPELQLFENCGDALRWILVYVCVGRQLSASSCTAPEQAFVQNKKQLSDIWGEIIIHCAVPMLSSLQPSI